MAVFPAHYCYSLPFGGTLMSVVQSILAYIHDCCAISTAIAGYSTMLSQFHMLVNGQLVAAPGYKVINPATEEVGVLPPLLCAYHQSHHQPVAL